MFSAASKSASGGKLITETFTSNRTWVAPATTGYIVSASGNGGAATADTPTRTAVATFSAGRAAGPFGNAPFAQWSTLYNAAVSFANSVAAGSGTRLVSVPGTIYSIATNDTWDNNSFTDPYWINGTYSLVEGFNSPPTSGNITHASLTVTRSWNVVVDTFTLGNNGAATTAFSRSFPGGTLTGSAPTRTPVPPSTTTFTHIPVTPGVSYAIVVPSGGSLTITYIR
jgi:hypothetical protein